MQTKFPTHILKKLRLSQQQRAAFKSYVRTAYRHSVTTYAKIRRYFVADPRRGKTAIAACVVLISSVTTYNILDARREQQTAPGTPGAAIRAATLVKGTPEFPTLLPAGKTIDSLGGWTRVSPADRNAVFAYADTIGTAKINVSQQPLPEDFKTDTEIQVAELAKSFNARKKLVVNGVTVFIGTSVQGPQSVILVKKNTLILLKSSGTLPDDQWLAYVDSLQ